MTWTKAALIRALKTFAQTAVATIGTSYAFDKVNLVAVLGTAIIAGCLSVLTSLTGLPEAKEE